MAVIAILTLAWVHLQRPGPAPDLPREVLAAAALPSPSPLATPTSTPDPHATAALESLLLSLDREDSLREASSLVRGLWRADDLRQTTLRVHLDQVRRFDLPVILEMFHPARRDTCYVALLSLDGDDALVVSGGKGEPMPTSVEDLDRFWTRDAVFVWRDFEGVMGSDPAQGRAWAAEALSRLGYAEANPAEAVERFQRDLNLLPDGILGSRTLIALYSGGNWPRPRLGRQP